MPRFETNEEKREPVSTYLPVDKKAFMKGYAVRKNKDLTYAYEDAVNALREKEGDTKE